MPAAGPNPQDRVRLQAGPLTVAVLPALGAKVTSLTWAGHEWLSPPARPLSAPHPLSGWADHDCSGWDECFPNIGADEPRGLADHGAVWSRPWRVTRRTATSLTTALSDQAWTFARTLTLHERGDHGIVEAAYEVHAHADLSQWAWAQHPMIAASTELRVECAESSPIRVDSAWAEGAPTSRVDWLAPDGVLATGTSLERGTGSAAKVWLERRPAWLAVRAGGHRLRWLLEESGAPHIGLWVNLGGWTAGVPLMHVGVEPAFGAHDAPVAAYDGGAGPSLRAGDSHAWRVLLELTDNDKR